MGMSRDDYVIFGAEFDYDKYFDYDRDDHEEHSNKTDIESFGVFYDCMSGEFCYVGVCLAHTDGLYEGFEGNGVDITEKLKLVKPDVLAQQINTLFGTTYEPKDFKLFAVTIWR